MISVHTRKPPRRLWRISRLLLLGIVVAITAAFAADRVWVRGNGIVAGQLTSVAPVVEGRLKRLFVRCLDHVLRGERIAEFENEATVEAAAQQVQQLQLQLMQARAQVEIADREAQAAQKLVEAQAALEQQQVVVLKAEDELVERHNVAVLAWEQAKAAVARAEAETKAAEFVYQTKRADQKMAELNGELLQRRIASFRNSPELTGHFYLYAPKDGIVTECDAMPGDVIPPKAPIFQIFNPNDTYAVVFFDPGDLPKLGIGQSFSVEIDGLGRSVTGRLTGFYPELSALPRSLTRYFWQQEMWAQYVPARLDFADLTAAERSRVFAWAQLSASSWRGWRLPALAAIEPWRWSLHGASADARRPALASPVRQEAHR